MKRKIWAGCFLAFVFSANAQAVPDARDSVILESKTAAATAGASGSGVVRIRVWITNKDSLAYMVLPLIERSLSGGAYMTLSYPRSFSGVVAPLTGTLRYFPGVSFRYNSASPDTFLLAAGYDGSDPASIEPPNAVRKGIWDIKFDTVTAVSSEGTVEFDSGRVSGQAVQFTTAPPAVDVPAHFVRSTVSVSSPCYDLRAALEQFGPAARGSWRMVRLRCRNAGTCAVSPTLVWKAPSQAAAIFGYSEAYPTDGGPALEVTTTENQTDKSVSWLLPAVGAGQGFDLWARYQIPCNLANGTSLLTTVRAEPVQFDLDTSDNVDTVRKVVVAGEPPCDAPGMAAGVAAASAYGEVYGIEAIDTLTLKGNGNFTYAITFQNVGGGTAGNILIQDTLDVNLNEATFDSAGASDSYALLASGGALAWDFGGINLPDSLTDPVGSVGFVAFQVSVDAGLPDGTEIQNQAVLTYDNGVPFVTAPAVNPVCLAARGDVNGDGQKSAADIVTLIGCVFMNPGDCTLCVDYNCDGRFSAADIVLDIGAVFLEAVIECL